jgi:uncharacterized membrane protein YeaQ/YmgE (transglycosylase-associated protein family)
MHIIITLIVGLIVGGLAKLVMPGKDPGGLIVTMLLGVAGAFIAGMIGQALGWYETKEAPGIIASILGALVVLGVYRAVIARRAVW